MVLFDEFVHSFWAISTAYLMLVVYFIVFSVIWKRRKKTTNSFCFLFTCAPFWKSQTRVVRVCCFALLCFVDSLTAIELSSLYVMCTTTTLVWTRLHVKKKPIHNYHVIACFYTLILSVHNHHRATHKPRKKKKNRRWTNGNGKHDFNTHLRNHQKSAVLRLLNISFTFALLEHLLTSKYLWLVVFWGRFIHFVGPCLVCALFISNASHFVFTSSEICCTVVSVSSSFLIAKHQLIWSITSLVRYFIQQSLCSMC